MKTIIGFKPHSVNKEYGRVYFPKMKEDISEGKISINYPWDSNLYSENWGKYGREIASSVLGIRGVTNIMLTPYELDVHISPVYSWDEVHPLVIDMFRKVFNLEEVEIVDLDSSSKSDD